VRATTALETVSFSCASAGVYLSSFLSSFHHPERRPVLRLKATETETVSNGQEGV